MKKERNTMRSEKIKVKVIVSAGDAITAKLVQEAGFDGIWVSGFEVSARLGLPDNGSLTMTEMLNVCKPIVEAVNIPVWVDVDTGYGNFKRTVDEFEKIGVYGLCVEDNVENQKKNSLWGNKAPLMNRVDFANKINVKKKTIKIMARTEALIRGYGEKEARKRLCYYAMKKSVDYILPHARKSVDILRVTQSVVPAAIVPTKFPCLTNKHFKNLGYSMVIWANQTERVKIKAIRHALGELKITGCAESIEKKLSATLDDMKGLTPSA